MSKKTDQSDTTPPSMTTIERISFHDVDNVFCALHEAFILNNPNGKEIDQRFLGAWYSFLSMSGWTEDQYFDALDQAEEGTCPDCGSPIDHEEEDDEKVIRNNVVSLKPPKKNELN